MKRFILTGLIAVSLLSISCAHAQDADDTAVKKTETLPADSSTEMPAAKEEKGLPSEIAVYGEVGDVSVAANTLTVQYYDYDTDTEKTITITVEPNTKFENAPNIGGIKKGDWVDVTYTASGAKNTAVSIVLEQEDEGEKALAPETEADKDDMSGSIPEESSEKM